MAEAGKKKSSGGSLLGTWQSAGLPSLPPARLVNGRSVGGSSYLLSEVLRAGTGRQVSLDLALLVMALGHIGGSRIRGKRWIALGSLDSGFATPPPGRRYLISPGL